MWGTGRGQVLRGRGVAQFLTGWFKCLLGISQEASGRWFRICPGVQLRDGDKSGWMIPAVATFIAPTLGEVG